MADARRRYLRRKRVLDVGASCVGLVLTAPVMVVIALAIKTTSRGPVLFRQNRPGLHGVPFALHKFRTMSSRRDADGALLPDGERLTPLGRFLRRSSLDELPELVNVLRGQMSLVGPRPLLVEYLPLYTREQARRHDVRPGITGWAQVHGRNNLSWGERFELDVWYVEHARLRLDLHIIKRTLWQVLHGRGVTQRGHATAQKFTGSPQGTPS